MVYYQNNYVLIKAVIKSISYYAYYKKMAELLFCKSVLALTVSSTNKVY